MQQSDAGIPFMKGMYQAKYIDPEIPTPMRIRYNVSLKL